MTQGADGPGPIVVSADDLLASAAAIQDSIATWGYAILQPWANDVDTLRRVGSLFGTIQSHIRANDQGVVGVGGPQREDAEWHAYRSEYHGLGNKDVAPHSDGTFVDGLVRYGDEMLRVGPPRFVILQVARHADEGGASILVDGKAVLEALLDDDPQMAGILLTPGCITYCRDDQLALDKQVFRLVDDHRVKIRFRGDSKAYSPPWALPAVQRLVSEYHLSPSFQRRLDVAEGQILVADNTRVLHGRERFTNEATESSDGRKLHRLWILDEESTALTNLQGELPTSRALNPYVPYGPVHNELAVAEPLKLATGIHLSPEAAARAQGLLETSARPGAPPG